MALQVLNTREGWIVDNYSGILHTTDGGKTWNYVQLPANDHLFVGITFVDRTHGWAITFEGAIYRYQAP